MFCSVCHPADHRVDWVDLASYLDIPFLLEHSIPSRDEGYIGGRAPCPLLPPVPKYPNLQISSETQMPGVGACSEHGFVLKRREWSDSLQAGKGVDLLVLTPSLCGSHRTLHCQLPAQHLHLKVGSGHRILPCGKQGGFSPSHFIRSLPSLPCVDKALRSKQQKSMPAGFK